MQVLNRKLEQIQSSITDLSEYADEKSRKLKEIETDLKNTTTVLQNAQNVSFHFKNAFKSYSHNTSLFQDLQKSSPDQPSADQLVSVRKHLLKLSATQPNLQKCQDSSHTDLDSEVNVLEILTIWQRLFKDTFLQYYRLSTQLMKSEDINGVLRLWDDYLKHVEGFLATPLPQNYSGLSENQHICEVHENLLNSQKEIFEKNVKPEIAERFRHLVTVQNEILLKLRDRHTELERRIVVWDQYNSLQDELLGWIKEMEQTRSRIQLYYLNIKRVPKTKQNIELILKRIPEGEEKSLNLKKLQKEILMFCDESLSASIKISHGAMDQRISNLKAALETWLDFINRIMVLETRYNSQVKGVQDRLAECQQTYSTTVQRNVITEPDCEQIIQHLKSKKQQIVETQIEIEQIMDLLEELKECVSPHDLKSMRQIICILGHQRDDLEQQFTCLINDLGNKMSLWNVFNERYENFVAWMDCLERRIHSCAELAYVNHPDDVQRYIETEINTETALKERDRDWLVSNGKQLLTIFSDANRPDELREVQYKLNHVLERWESLKHLSRARGSELSDMKVTIMKLEIRIAELRAWLFKMEKEFSRTIPFESLTEDSYRKALRDMDSLQRQIENESFNFGEVLNLCEMLFSDVNIWKSHFNLGALSLAIDNIERRWKHLCHMSTDRKRQIISVWGMFKEIQQIHDENQPWLEEKQTNINSLQLPVEFTKTTVPVYLEQIASELRDMQSREKILTHLEKSYRQLFIIDFLDSENMVQLFQHIKFMITTWNQLYETLIKRFEMEFNLFNKFLELHEIAILKLTQFDAVWTEIEISRMEETAKWKRLVEIAEELKEIEKILKVADESGSEIQRLYQDGKPIQDLMDEYQTLYVNIKQRVGQTAQEPVSEQSISVQVNTLTSITPKDAYIMELKSAIEETKSNLNAMESDLNTEPGKKTSAKPTKLIGACESSIELIRHLNHILKDECNSTVEESEDVEVERLSIKYQELLVLWKSREKADQEKK